MIPDKVNRSVAQVKNRPPTLLVGINNNNVSLCHIKHK